MGPILVVYVAVLFFFRFHTQNNTGATSQPVTNATTEPATGATSQPVTQPPSPEEPVDDDFDHNIVVFVLLGISLVLLLTTIALHLGFK